MEGLLYDFTSFLNWKCLLDVIQDLLAEVVIHVEPGHDLERSHQVDGAERLPQRRLRDININRWRITHSFIHRDNVCLALRTSALFLWYRNMSSPCSKHTDVTSRFFTRESTTRRRVAAAAYRVVVGVHVRDEDGGDLGQGLVHAVPVVSAELTEGSLPAVQQHRLTRATSDRHTASKRRRSWLDEEENSV